jgi:threonine/homoserine/homoserine lactone efflux protein
MMTLSAIGQGMLLGVALSFSLGPAFFGLIQISLRYGYRSGIAMAAGIFISDLIYLLLAFFGISQIIMNKEYALVVGISGGVLLIVYGIAQIVKKPEIQNIDSVETLDSAAPTIGGMALRGFLMNMFNPFVIFLWIGTIGLASKNFNHDFSLIVTFFSATLATVFGTDILKSLAAGRIKYYINETTIHKINMIAGLILIICGLVLIVRVFVERPWEQLH